MITRGGSKKIIAKNVEYFDTPAKRLRGLLKYEAAPENYCAVFQMPLRGFLSAVHTYGMKFEIDLVFCAADGTVIAQYRNIGPGKFIMPLRCLFGASPYLLEFSRCELGDLQNGEKISWEAA